MEIISSAVFLLTALVLATAQDLSFPEPLTGAPNCIIPLRQIVCTVDTRSGFVAGVQYGPGPQYGLRSVCSRGGTDRDGFMYQELYQTTWDMTDLNGTSFPTNSSGQPNLQYYFPLGALVSQMIVLQAANPIGEAFGNIPAIIFRYYTPGTAAPGIAVCGNALYANAYLNPFSEDRLPPTPPSLMSVYVNPLSATTPAYLSSFQGSCSGRGYGFLGGDPHGSSKYHLQLVMKVCFAPVSHAVQFPPPTPVVRPEVEYDWDVPHQPCYYNKKDAQKSTSISCALTGETVATGKYGVIMVGTAGRPYEAVRDEATGTVTAAAFNGTEMYQGSVPDVAMGP